MMVPSSALAPPNQATWFLWVMTNQNQAQRQRIFLIQWLFLVNPWIVEITSMNITEIMNKRFVLTSPFFWKYFFELIYDFTSLRLLRYCVTIFKSSDLVNQTFFPTVPVNLFELNKSRKLDDSNFFCGPVTFWVMGSRLYLLKSTTNQREFYLTTPKVCITSLLSDPTCLMMKKMKKKFVFFRLTGINILRSIII